MVPLREHCIVKRLSVIDEPLPEICTKEGVLYAIEMHYALWVERMQKRNDCPGWS
jgi:hypothetical protein